MSEDIQTPLTCYNHPQRETVLRCNRCERPICNECAVLTPTGYRCKECVRGQQKIFDTARSLDYPLAVVIAAVLSYLGSYIAAYLGFFTLFLAPIAGVVIAEVVRWVTRRRRSKLLFQLAAGAAVLGSLPLLAMNLLGFLGGFLTAGAGISLVGGGLFGLIWQGAYTILIATTVFYRMSGIEIRRR